MPSKWKRKKLVHLCPSCEHGRVKIVDPVFLSVSTTQQKTWEQTQYASWITPMRRRSLTYGRLYAFTDGSTTGAHAAVLVRLTNEWPPRYEVEEHSRAGKATPARNVTAEVMGVVLALAHVPKGSEVCVVSDFLGTACWLQGYHTLGCPHTLLRLRALVLQIHQRDLAVHFVHHKGHQKDSSDFTHWNCRADALASHPERPTERGD